MFLQTSRRGHIKSSFSFSLSPVCSPAKLPATAGHAVVRRLSGLEETTLGRQTGHLLHHRPPVSCLLTGMEGRGKNWDCKEGITKNKTMEMKERERDKDAKKNKGNFVARQLLRETLFICLLAAGRKHLLDNNT